MPQIGQTFNPYRKFTGLFVPEPLARCSWISPGTKLVYGRLARYAGQNGICNPSVPKLAAEVGLKKRQVQTHLANLEKADLIRRISRSSGNRQTSNGYQFIWHVLFEGVQDPAPGGMQDAARAGVQDPAYKESHLEESHNEEKLLDLDCLPRIAKTSDSRQDSICAQYAQVKQALADYMMMPNDGERVEPTERLVVEVMDAAGGASDNEVIGCLRYLRNERGLRPGTKHGPRGVRWFVTTVAEYFHQRRSREMVYAHDPGKRTELSKEVFDEMTNAIETE
jgi:hypothetical protein